MGGFGKGKKCWEIVFVVNGKLVCTEFEWLHLLLSSLRISYCFFCLGNNYEYEIWEIIEMFEKMWG